LPLFDGGQNSHQVVTPGLVEIEHVPSDMTITFSEPTGSVINSDFWKRWASLSEDDTKNKLRAMGVSENFLTDDSSSYDLEVTFPFQFDSFSRYLAIIEYKQARALKQAQRRKRQTRARTGRR
jgi:hypothetical protein